MSAAPDSGTEAVGEGLGADRQAKTQRCERPHDTPIGGETRERVGVVGVDLWWWSFTWAVFGRCPRPASPRIGFDFWRCQGRVFRSVEGCFWAVVF